MLLFLHPTLNAGQKRCFTLFSGVVPLNLDVNTLDLGGFMLFCSFLEAEHRFVLVFTLFACVVLSELYPRRVILMPIFAHEFIE